MQLPDHFSATVATAWDRAHSVPGGVEELEFLGLMMLAVAAPLPGTILEVGGDQGRSTVGLATMAQLCGWEPVVSLAPQTAKTTDGEGADGWTIFEGALRNAGVLDNAELHRAGAAEPETEWTRPIRLLILGGESGYAGAMANFRKYAHYLLPGGIVAMYRTLDPVEGPIRVFVEQVLRNQEFGAAGFLGGIGWARKEPTPTKNVRKARERLARKASRLLPLVAPPQGDEPPIRLQSLRYGWARSGVPHEVPTPQEWAEPL